MKYFLRYVFVGLMLLNSICAVQATVWNVDNLPIPYLKDRRLHVTDPDHLLSDGALATANCYLDSLETNLGVQSLFVVVGHVKGGDCFRLSQDLGNQYGVGTQKDRNGLVIVIAQADHRYFIAPGKGLEEYLTDVECNDIAQQCIVANMRVDSLNVAVVSTAQAIYWNLKGDHTHYDAIVQKPDTENLWDMVILASMFFMLPLLLFIRWLLILLGIIRPRSWRYSKYKRHHDIDDFFPPFLFGGGGGFGRDGGGFSGGSFGGGSFGGGGSGGSW